MDESILKRIEGIEKYLGLPPIDQEQPDSVIQAKTDTLEVKVGEYGLAWAGGMVLFPGMIFLMTYAWNLGYQRGASLKSSPSTICSAILGSFRVRLFSPESFSSKPKVSMDGNTGYDCYSFLRVSC